MNVKKMTFSAILMAIGYILHQMVPGIPFLGGMKMDFLLVMMFFSIFLMDSYKEVLAVSLVCGILSALSTTFPGGQVANLLDKFITGALVYVAYRSMGNFSNTVKVSLIALFGTIISGSVFLFTGLSISGAPLSFMDLFLGIVLPTSVLNTMLSVLIERILERSGYVRVLNLLKS